MYKLTKRDKRTGERIDINIDECKRIIIDDGKSKIKARQIVDELRRGKILQYNANDFYLSWR
jgi:hypothetical protein